MAVGSRSIFALPVIGAAREVNAMTGEHWFDTLNKWLVQSSTRQAVLRAAAASVASFVTGEVSKTEAARKQRNKRNKKRKKNRNKDRNKPNPDPSGSCSNGACAQEWAGNQAEIDYCEFICRQCDGDDPRQFCITEGDPFDPNKVAFCCAEGRECCGNQCCGDPLFSEIQCCDDQCVSTRTDELHCGDCGQTCVGPGLTCCDGDCVRTRFDENHCGACNQPCVGPDLQCCDGECTNTRFNRDHCGGCDQSCTGLNRRCCDGECVSTLTPEHCGGCSPCPSPFTCCDGFCVDTDFNHDHCGACNASCQPAQYCCHGVGRGCIDSCGGFCTCGSLP